MLEDIFEPASEGGNTNPAVFFYLCLLAFLSLSILEQRVTSHANSCFHTQFFQQQ